MDLTASVAAIAPDPLRYTEELPRIFTVFPLGQAVEIATNSAAIEESARAVWARHPRLFESPAMRFRIGVTDNDSINPEGKSAARGQGHLVSLIRDAGNFAVADLRQGFAFAWLTRDVAAHRTGLIEQFLEPVLYLIVSARHFAQVHAACVALNGRSVLLCGDSGAGKTCLSYACARTGWQLVSGDAIQIERSSKGSRIVGRPFSLRFRDTARQLFPELRGLPVAHSQSGKRDIAVDTADLAIETAAESQASHVVFLNRSTAPVEPFFTDVLPEEALAYFEQVVFYGDEGLRAAQRACLVELVARPLCRLTYSDLPRAERALRHLMNVA